MIHLAWCLAFQDIKLEVHTRDDATRAQDMLDGLAGQFGMVVFLTQMAQPHMAEVWRGILRECFAACRIAQMTDRTDDTVLQMLWVWT